MQVLTFNLENEKYAVETRIVENIENFIPFSKVPKSKPYVMGLINIRGAVVPLINIKKFLNLQNSVSDQKLVVINVDGIKYALSVDDVDEVIDISEEMFQSISSRNESVIKFGDRLVTFISQENLSSF